MNPVLAYLLGVATPFVALGVFLAVVVWRDRKEFNRSEDAALVSRRAASAAYRRAAQAARRDGEGRS